MRLVALLASCALFVSGCSSCGSEETPPETIPFKELSAEPGNADVVPEESDADDEDSGSDGEGDDDSTAAQPAQPAQPGATPKPGPKTGGGGSIASCCSSLNVAARVEKDAKQAARLRQAAGVCSSIDSMVRSGKTSRTSALRQVRAVAGSKAPASCR